MAEKTKSAVWLYFTPSESDAAATCIVCKKTCKRDKGNTSNLISHLARMHRKEHQHYKEEDDRRKAEAHAEQQVCCAFCNVKRLTLTTPRNSPSSDILIVLCV